MAEPDLDKLNFYSGVNYMKRSELSGSDDISTAQIDIDHNLNYIPQFVWYADVLDDGFLWYGGELVAEGTDSTSGGAPLNPEVNAWTTDTTLSLYPIDVSSSRPVKWVIYLDYGA